MSRTGGKKKGFNSSAGSQPRGPMIQCHVNAKTMCKIEHLKNLAAESSFPLLGPFFGERLAAMTEALGLRGDSSMFVCERCESIQQPGHNCSIRIEKNKSRGTYKPTSQNNIVYRCHFRSHRNLMRGTPKGYVKEICPPKPKPVQKLKKDILGNPTTTTLYRKVDPDASLLFDGQNLETSWPATPLMPTDGLSLLDSKRRKRNRSRANIVDEPQISSTAADFGTSILGSSKRRKKSWTSLKEIAESSGQDIGKKLMNLTIPVII